MKYLLMIFAVALFAGCSTVTYEKRDPVTGKVIESYNRSGVNDWSSGIGKNLPFSHISVSGVQVPNLKK